MIFLLIAFILQATRCRIDKKQVKNIMNEGMDYEIRDWLTRSGAFKYITSAHEVDGGPWSEYFFSVESHVALIQEVEDLFENFWIFIQYSCGGKHSMERRQSSMLFSFETSNVKARIYLVEGHVAALLHGSQKPLRQREARVAEIRSRSVEVSAIPYALSLVLVWSRDGLSDHVYDQALLEMEEFWRSRGVECARIEAEDLRNVAFLTLNEVEYTPIFLLMKEGEVLDQVVSWTTDPERMRVFLMTSLFHDLEEE